MLIGCMLSAHAIAANSDSTAVTEHYARWWDPLYTIRLNNTALYRNAFNQSLSQIKLNINYDKQKEAFILQKGDGSFLTELSVDSYLRLSRKTTVWGNASYREGKIQNIKWNSTADYDLLYPYVMADSVGGNLKTERYQFSGGYATLTGRFSIGGEIKFRAEHEYRNIDPRPRNIVSDLTMRAGIATDIKSHTIALGLEGEIYKQTNSVTFYSETGEITEYQMTGLATYYKRFVGNASALYYSGTSIGANINWIPARQKGFFLTGTVNNKSYERKAASLNSLPLTTLHITSIATETGWLHNNGNDWNANIGLKYERRNGEEHIVGNASSSIYPIILTLNMYKSHITDYYIRGTIGSSKNTNWHISPKIGFIDYKATYLYPVRSLSLSKIYADIELQLLHRFGNNIWLNWNVSGSYYANTNAKMTMPYIDMDESFINMIDYSFKYYKANYTLWRTKIRGDYHIRESQMGLFAELGVKAAICTAHNNGATIELSAGITF